MLKSNTLNMTEGKPLGLLCIFAIPLLIGNLFQQAYNLADSMIVGRLLGADSLAAVGATGSISFLFFSICNGISSGGGIITSQFFGAGDTEKVKKAIVNSGYIMFSSSLLTGCVAFALVPTVLKWLGIPETILPEAVTYMRMTCAGVPLVAVYNYASSMQRALGDSRTPLIFLILSCFLNVGLDLLFVGSFHMGVFGAALATMLSQLIAGAGCMAHAIHWNPYFSLERRHFVPDLKIAGRAVRLGLPLALQWSLIAVSTTALQTVANGFGPAAMAAYTATGRMEQLVMMPYGSLSMALSTYSGQNMGAGKKERLRAGFRDSFIATTVLALAMTVVMQLLGESFVGLFVRESEVVALGGSVLKITSPFYVFLGLIYVCRGVLNGIGDALFAFVNGAVEAACRILIPILLIQVIGMGVMAIWLTAGVTWMLSGLSCYIRYLRWKSRHLMPEQT